MSIQVDQVSKYYGEQAALDQVSFSVPSGQIVGFLGPNGAGKSTMMKILTCFIPQSKGKVQVCGFDVEEQPMEVKKRVGYLPEHNPLYLDLYVREYLDFVAGIYGIAPEKVEEMIQKTGLSPEANKRIGQLSKGYRQRVGLAQALIHDPEVLILDEPTTGLDPNQLVEIRELIREVGKEKTVLLSTHIMQEVEVLCDRVIIINKGKIVADQPTEMLRKAGNRVLIRVEFDRTPDLKELKELKGVFSVESRGGNKLRIEAEGKTDLRSVLFKYAVDREMTILEINQEELHIEEVFRQLTQ
ncbi:MAG: gliding motility-associated ABC transporter ATP-binding subunit GldA [Bacteroidota bacterium]|nr:gliding motility-associated ABC transporter ATP-binding subunit GldA [Bacteroidota bacterium]